MKTLFLSPLQPPKGGGGVGGVSRLRFPPGPHLRSSRFSRHPRLRRKNRSLRGLGSFCGEKAQAPGGPGPKPWGPGPQAPWRRLPAKCKPCVLKTWVRVSKRYHNPQSATLEGVGWFPKAELYSSMRGGVPVFAPAFQLLGRARGPGQQAPEPCIPVKNSKNAPVLIGS